jgi:Na+/citrate or Na+/malate symporter
MTEADNSDGKFEWEVSKTLGDKAIYGIQITWDENKEIFQYSFPFHIAGSGAGGSSDGFSSIYSTASSNSTVTKTSGVVTSTPIGNLTSITTGRLTPIASATSTPATTRTTASTSSTSTAAAPTNIGSTLALFGGLAMAVFAL